MGCWAQPAVSRGVALGLRVCRLSGGVVARPAPRASFPSRPGPQREGRASATATAATTVLIARSSRASSRVFSAALSLVSRGRAGARARFSTPRRPHAAVSPRALHVHHRAASSPPPSTWTEATHARSQPSTQSTTGLSLPSRSPHGASPRPRERAISVDRRSRPFKRGRGDDALPPVEDDARARAAARLRGAEGRERRHVGW